MDPEPPLSSPQPGPSQDASPRSTDRRKSGRVTRKPELYSDKFGADGATAGSSKRKRIANDNEEEDADAEDASDPEDDESGEEEPDEEELRAKRRAARKGSAKKATSESKGKSKSRSAKKPKVTGNGVGNQLAFRPAMNGRVNAPRPRKVKVRPSLAVGERGLYAEVFGKGRNADTTAAEWLTRYQKEQTNAMRDLVNFIIRCSGTDLTIETGDIKDVDHVTGRVADLMMQYDQQGISEWPLISKSRTFRAFRPVLEDFFKSLIRTLHHSSALYEDQVLFENIELWLSVFSSSACRPFRHTATVMALAIMTTLCEIARDLMTTVSTSRKQLENEKKKKNVNQGRIGAMKKAIEQGEHKLEILDEYLKDGFNVIFVNRYRDIDPIIRSACMVALGQWMRAYRDFFVEGQFLRYFGWLLSDPVVQTRTVCLIQLRYMYESKYNIAALRTFTGKFLARIVEMTAHDTEVGVRVLAIELVGLIRDFGLLDPADIDTVGKLVFDSEPKVRKAAGRFFVANVQDVFDSTVEEVRDDINEMFGDEDEDDFESPKQSWIKFKCLVDTLQAYDEPEDESDTDQPTASKDMLLGTPLATRFALVTEAIYPHLQELSQWQSLAGYLLYDHSQIAEDPSEDDTSGAIRKLYKMEEGQEVILLEVLCCAVKMRVLQVAKSDIDRRGRKVKTLTDKIPELQEEIAHNLAQITPQLMNKYGSVPETASAVLRLEHLVDLDKIQDLQKDATAYTSLLSDINKQFLTHSDQDVLAEASAAFIHAKSSDDMREALDSKVQELWEEITDTLHTLAQKKEVLEGRSIPDSTLIDLNNTIGRTSNLASVTDCTQFLEAAPTRSKGKSKSSAEVPFNILMHLAERGLRENEEDEETAEAETDLVNGSLRTLLFYFMWKVQSLTTALAAGKASFDTAYFETVTKSRDQFVSTLLDIMKARSGLDDIRFFATTTLLDLQTLFGTLRHAGQIASNDEDVILQTQSLVHEFSSDAQNLIGKIHSVAQRTYAKKLHVFIEPEVGDEPDSDSELDDESSEDENDSDPEVEAAKLAARQRLPASAVAEQRLCELTGKIVLAIIGRVLDASGEHRGQLRQRLARYKFNLSQNYREVLSFLDEPKLKPPSRPKPKQPPHKDATKDQPGPSKRQKNSKSTERIEDDDDEEDSPIEEDDDEDLRVRGLVEDDPIEDDDEGENPNPPADQDEDEVMGD